MLRQYIHRIITVYVKRMESFTSGDVHLFRSGVAVFIRRNNISLHESLYLFFLQVYCTFVQGHYII